MGKRILVVEDEVPILELVQEILETEGYQVTKAANGKEGLLKAKEIVPDLIISDIMMQEMTGGAMTARIKEDERLRDIPIIYLTAVVDKDEAELTGHHLAGENLLAKPFTSEELLKMVAKVLT